MLILSDKLILLLIHKGQESCFGNLKSSSGHYYAVIEALDPLTSLILFNRSSPYKIEDKYG